MPVIRLKAGQVCYRCGSSASLPHADPHECLDAISQEVVALLNRTRELSAARRRIVEQQAAEIDNRRARIADKLKHVRKRKSKYSA